MSPLTVFTTQVDEINVDLDDVFFDHNGKDDILDLSQVTPENDFDLPFSVSTPGVNERVHIFSYAGHDLIIGSAFADCIKTGEGDYDNEPDDDWAFGLGGDDFIEGKAGSDHLYGGDITGIDSGDDIIWGFWRDSENPGGTIESNDGDDFIYGGDGIDKLFDGHGSDWLYGGLGADEYNMDSDEVLDRVIDEIIRDIDGLGDFDGVPGIDRNWIEYPVDVGDVEITFDHDYTSVVDWVVFTVEDEGGPARGTKFLLLETIDAMFDALELGTFFEQWDFFDDNQLIGFDAAANDADSDAKYFIENIVGTRFGDVQLDGDVDVADMNIINGNWQDTGIETWEEGDLNGDGDINSADLTLLGMYWQWGV
jgi:hypothetical protein